MYVMYGDYRFPDNSCKVTTRSNVIENGSGVPYALDVSASVTCLFISTATNEATIQSELSAQDLAARSALSVPGRNFGLYHDDGTLSSTRIINTPNMLKATRVTGVDAPAGDGPEYASVRTLFFTVEASYLINAAVLVGPGGSPVTPGTGPNGELLDSWKETLTFQGNGGPRKLYQEVIDGPAIEQQVLPYTIVRATQSGTAVGILRPPPYPPPIFPNPISESFSQAQESPERTSQGHVKFPISWSYSFQSATPLVGTPTYWR